MSLKLYFAARTRATRPRWLLEELGVPYELVRLDLKAGEHKKPEYLAIHPQGAVPALVDGPVTVIESAAICLYLADKFLEKGLAPKPGSPERGSYYQWMVYSMATLEPPIAEYANHTAFYPPEKRRPEKAEAAKKKLDEQVLPPIAAALKGREALTGTFSAADVMTASILNWAKSMKLLEAHPTLLDYVTRLTARSAVARANS